MFDSRIFNAGANAIPRRKSVPLFPIRDKSNDRRLTQAGIDDTKRTKIDPEMAADVKKAAEKKQEAGVEPQTLPPTGLTSDDGVVTAGKTAPISGSLVGKMMKIADIPVGAKYPAAYGYSGFWIKANESGCVSCENGKYYPYGRNETNCLREVIADPVVERGDLVQCLSDNDMQVSGVALFKVGEIEPKDGIMWADNGVVCWPVRSLKIIEKGIQKK